MFADGGQWLAGALAVAWAALVLLHAAGARHGRGAGAAVGPGVLAALGVALVLFGAAAVLGDRIDDSGGGATGVDLAAWNVVPGHRTAGLTAATETLNVAGGVLPLTGLAVVAAGLLSLRGRRADAGVVLAAPAVSTLTGAALKLGYARPRPPESGHLVDVSGFSLPSGHALDATIVLGVLAVAAVRMLRAPAARVCAVVLAAAGAVVAGASRVYLGVHWATDVLTGWLFGGTWVALCVALLMALRADPRRTTADVAVLSARPWRPAVRSGT